MNPPLARALLSFEGLSVGDAFGKCFFSAYEEISPERMARNLAPAPPWRHTDDTEMSASVIEILARHGRIDQDDLARTFAQRYMSDPERGYGGGAKIILVSIYAGQDWRTVSAAAFNGGSMGNGSAMRIPPLGAFFADDLPRLIEEAHRSAAVTHAHPEGSAGAIATALATAYAWNHRNKPIESHGYFEFIGELTPPGSTCDGIKQAMDVPLSASVQEAVAALGNGERITCPDTVPFCLWAAARHFNDYVGAMWATASAEGDIDTNCAIVGGIVACASPDGAVPPDWIAARGPVRIKSY
jgi:ADP-ribosylglycohydrolase